VTLPEPSHGVAKPNGGAGGLLPIIDVAVTGIGRAVQTLPGIFAIYWLPWLLGTLVLVVLEVVVQDQLRLGRAPDWAREILWAPFMAMAYLMLVRWVLDGEPPARAINFEVGRTTWVATPIVAAWFVANITVSDAPMPMMRWLVLPSDYLAYRWEDATPYFYAFRFAAWLVNGALLPCFFGLIVVVAKCGWPDLRQLWRLLRLQPVRLLCISLLAAAAVGGLFSLGTQAQAWLGVGRLAPHTMIPWRANIHWALVAELPNFPLHFLHFAIEGSILAEAYRRLLAAHQPVHSGGQVRG
jgi:hypothetical protein